MRRLHLTALALLGTLAPAVAGQEAINTDAALQPPPGTLIYRQRFRYRASEAPHGPAEAKMLMVASNFIYGVSERLTLIAGVPLMYREMEPNRGMGDMEDFGLGDINALAKFQFYKNSFGVGSTAKAGLLAGAQLPSGDSPFSSHSVDPILGAVGTYAKDRHGFSAAGQYQLNTGGEADELRYDLAYTYRLSPASYADNDTTSLFGVIETTGLYETNGDNEILLSPGVQYVTQDWTLEATVSCRSTSTSTTGCRWSGRRGCWCGSDSEARFPAPRWCRIHSPRCWFTSEEPPCPQPRHRLRVILSASGSRGCTAPDAWARSNRHSSGRRGSTTPR